MNKQVQSLLHKIQSLKDCRYNLFFLQAGKPDLARWSNDNRAHNDFMMMFSPDMALVDCESGVLQLLQRDKNLLILVDFKEMLYSMSICRFNERTRCPFLPLRESDIALFLPDLELLVNAYVHNPRGVLK